MAPPRFLIIFGVGIEPELGTILDENGLPVFFLREQVRSPSSLQPSFEETSRSLSSIFLAVRADHDATDAPPEDSHSGSKKLDLVTLDIAMNYVDNRLSRQERGERVCPNFLVVAGLTHEAAIVIGGVRRFWKMRRAILCGYITVQDPVLTNRSCCRRDANKTVTTATLGRLNGLPGVSTASDPNWESTTSPYIVAVATGR